MTHSHVKVRLSTGRKLRRRGYLSSGDKNGGCLAFSPLLKMSAMKRKAEETPSPSKPDTQKGWLKTRRVSNRAPRSLPDGLLSMLSTALESQCHRAGVGLKRLVFLRRSSSLPPSVLSSQRSRIYRSQHSPYIMVVTRAASPSAYSFQSQLCIFSLTFCRVPDCWTIFYPPERRI